MRDKSPRAQSSKINRTGLQQQSHEASDESTQAGTVLHATVLNLERSSGRDLRWVGGLGWWERRSGDNGNSDLAGFGNWEGGAGDDDSGSSGRDGGDE